MERITHGGYIKIYTGFFSVTGLYPLSKRVGFKSNLKLFYILQEISLCNPINYKTTLQ